MTATTIPTVTANTTDAPAKRKRGNPTGKSHEVPRARAFLTAHRVSHESMTDRAAVQLSERIAKAEVCVDAIGLAVIDNANPRRLLILEERAGVAIDGLPRNMRPKLRAALRAAVDATRAGAEPEPAVTVADILRDDAAVLAQRRARFDR